MYNGRGILGLSKICSFIWNFSSFHSNFHKLIWAPLTLMDQPNLDVDDYKVNKGKLIYAMYNGRGILGIWTKFHHLSFFSNFHSNFYKLIWAIPPVMHQPNPDVNIERITSGKFSPIMYVERRILGVWKICSFICHF